MATINEVTTGIFRISTEAWGFPITLNQFLIAGEHPALIHTGTFPLYDDVRKAVSEVLDPKRLEYVVVPHFESDECGGMDRFVEDAPNAVLVCSEAGSVLNLSGWNYSGPVRGVRDGDVIELGEHRLRFLETPHVHHWDSMMAFEETTASLFPADLFIQPGDQPAIVKEDLGKEMCALYREVGIFASHEPVLQTVKRIEKMNPQWLHPMHGGSLPEEVIPRYINALRKENFAFEGKIFGRELPT
jgi:flavorubredoxin